LGLLWEEIYSEVHRMAQSLLRKEGALKPIDTTVLVHELYMKMGGTTFDNLPHLFGSLARMMGQIVIDAGRRRSRQRKHENAAGTAQPRSFIDTGVIGVEDDAELDMAAVVVQALDRLDRLTPRAAAVAWLRYIGGLSVPQVAQCLNVSDRTVKSDWAFARAWLHREIVSQGFRPRTYRTEDHQQ